MGEPGPIRASFDERDMERARYFAERKVDLVDVHSPGGDPRPRDVRLRRLVAGKLADHAVLHLMTRFYAKHEPGFMVEEYDQIRTDQFERPDPWDLRCIDPQGNELLVEVRSSFVHRISDVGRLWTVSVAGRPPCYCGRLFW